MRTERVSLELMVEDVSRTLAFWRDQLGFQVLAQEPEHEPTWAAVKLGEATVSFKSADRLRAEFDWFLGMPQGGTAMICVDVDDLNKWYAEISRRFSVIDHPHLTPCGAAQFAIRDPDGYVVIFQRFS